MTSTPNEPYLYLTWGNCPLVRGSGPHVHTEMTTARGALPIPMQAPPRFRYMMLPDKRIEPFDIDVVRVVRLFVPIGDDDSREYQDPPPDVTRILDNLGQRRVRYKYMPEWAPLWDDLPLDQRDYVWSAIWTHGETNDVFLRARDLAPTRVIKVAEEPTIQSEDITYHLRLFWGYRARMDTLGYDLCNLPEDAPQHIRQAAESLGQDTAEYRTFNGFNSMNWKPPQVRVHPPSRIYVYLPNESDPEWSFQTGAQPENARQIANTINLCRNVIPDNGAEPRRLPQTADAEFAVQRLPSLNFYGRTKYGEPLFRYSDPPTYTLDALREPLWPGEVWNPLMSWYDYCRKNHRIWPRGAELDGHPIAFFSAPARDAYKAMCEEYKPAYQKMMVQKSREHAEKMDDLRDEYWPPWGFSG